MFSSRIFWKAREPPHRPLDLTTCGIQYRLAGWNTIAPLAGTYASCCDAIDVLRPKNRSFIAPPPCGEGRQAAFGRPSSPKARRSEASAMGVGITSTVSEVYPLPDPPPEGGGSERAHPAAAVVTLSRWRFMTILLSAPR